MSNFINSLKFKLIRLIESNPILNLIIYNNISFFKLFLPHEKDYYGLKKLIPLNNNKDFIDVGGNIGLSTIGFRQLGYKNKILIFEPDKDYCIKKLNLLRKKIFNLKVFSFGLSERDEEKNFYQAYFMNIKMHFLSSFDKNYLKNIIRQVYWGFGFLFSIKSQNLRLKNFDKLNLATKPIFIKIDVEGFDHKVIKGMIKTINKYKPILLVELNKENINVINKILKKNYLPYRYIFEKNYFQIIKEKEIIDIHFNFKRKLNLSLPRNIFYIPKKFNF